VERLCDTYLSAPELAAEGAHVISTDEKTGMQALERLHETKPVRPGLVERVEFEYIRHGTLCLMANFDVVTGKVVRPSIGPTRKEVDFVAHIDHTIELDPLRLHTTSLLVAQPGRDLVLDPGSAVARAVQLHIPRRPAAARVRLHRVLQPRPRQALPVDLHWPPASNMNRMINRSAGHI